MHKHPHKKWYSLKSFTLKYSVCTIQRGVLRYITVNAALSDRVPRTRSACSQFVFVVLTRHNSHNWRRARQGRNFCCIGSFWQFARFPFLRYFSPENFRSFIVVLLLIIFSGHPSPVRLLRDIVSSRVQQQSSKCRERDDETLCLWERACEIPFFSSLVSLCLSSLFVKGV